MTHGLMTPLSGTHHEEQICKNQLKTNTISPKAPDAMKQRTVLPATYTQVIHRAALSSAGRQLSSAGRHYPQQDGTPIIHHRLPANGSPVHAFNPQNSRTAKNHHPAHHPLEHPGKLHILSRTALSSTGQHYPHQDSTHTTCILQQCAKVPPDAA
jgi:hypothetical protein